MPPVEKTITDWHSRFVDSITLYSLALFQFRELSQSHDFENTVNTIRVQSRLFYPSFTLVMIQAWPGLVVDPYSTRLVSSAGMHMHHEAPVSLRPWEFGLCLAYELFSYDIHQPSITKFMCIKINLARYIGQVPSTSSASSLFQQIFMDVVHGDRIVFE